MQTHPARPADWSSLEATPEEESSAGGLRPAVLETVRLTPGDVIGGRIQAEARKRTLGEKLLYSLFSARRRRGEEAVKKGKGENA
jgi:hypothetical protein